MKKQAELNNVSGQTLLVATGGWPRLEVVVGDVEALWAGDGSVVVDGRRRSLPPDCS